MVERLAESDLLLANREGVSAKTPRAEKNVVLRGLATARGVASVPNAAAAISGTLSALKFVGQRVVLTGLTSRPELNGQAGVCEKYVPDKKRYAVRLDGTPTDATPLALKVECLALETGSSTGGDARDPYGVCNLEPDARAAVEAQLLASLKGGSAVRAA